jgi:hypothetical protein
VLLTFDGVEELISKSCAVSPKRKENLHVHNSSHGAIKTKFKKEGVPEVYSCFFSMCKMSLCCLIIDEVCYFYHAFVILSASLIIFQPIDGFQCKCVWGMTLLPLQGTSPLYSLITCHIQYQNGDQHGGGNTYCRVMIFSVAIEAK